jgi:hypothetical protein
MFLVLIFFSLDDDVTDNVHVSATRNFKKEQDCRWSHSEEQQPLYLNNVASLVLRLVADGSDQV